MLKVNKINQYKSKKILSLDKAKKLIKAYQSKGKKIGLCHGGFDLIHPGHIKHFESASKLCDILIVSITADRFVSKRKGSGRPIYPDKLRAYVISSIEFVNYVVITNFKLGVDIIKLLKPDYYIKGPDYINKTTKGIISERKAIKDVDGDIKYTNEPPMSTTNIIKYIKEKIDNKNILIVIDRDGTIIKNNDYLGKNKNWRKEIIYNKNVINFISAIQTKYKTTSIVVSNQAGVARGYFTPNIVKEINKTITLRLTKEGIKINNWQFCPNVDSKYAKNNPQLKLNPKFIKEKTKRKPNSDMVFDGLKEIGKSLKDFTHIIVLGDRHEDKDLAKILDAIFIDVKNKKLVKQLNLV